jgi:hypothetical protein
MNFLLSLYLAALFVAFVPGVLVSLPPRGGKFTVLAVHALLFAAVWHYTHKAVWRATEGFQSGAANAAAMNAMNGMNGMNKKEVA